MILPPDPLQRAAATIFKVPAYPVRKPFPRPDEPWEKENRKISTGLTIIPAARVVSQVRTLLLQKAPMQSFACLPVFQDVPPKEISVKLLRWILADKEGQQEELLDAYLDNLAEPEALKKCQGAIWRFLMGPAKAMISQPFLLLRLMAATEAELPRECRPLFIESITFCLRHPVASRHWDSIGKRIAALILTCFPLKNEEDQWTALSLYLDLLVIVGPAQPQALKLAVQMIHKHLPVYRTKKLPQNVQKSLFNLAFKVQEYPTASELILEQLILLAILNRLPSLQPNNHDQAVCQLFFKLGEHGIEAPEAIKAFEIKCLERYNFAPFYMQRFVDTIAAEAFPLVCDPKTFRNLFCLLNCFLERKAIRDTAAVAAFADIILGKIGDHPDFIRRPKFLDRKEYCMTAVVPHLFRVASSQEILLCIRNYELECTVEDIVPFSNALLELLNTRDQLDDSTKQALLETIPAVFAELPEAIRLQLWYGIEVFFMESVKCWEMSKIQTINELVQPFLCAMRLMGRIHPSFKLQQQTIQKLKNLPLAAGAAFKNRNLLLMEIAHCQALNLQ